MTKAEYLERIAPNGFFDLYDKAYWASLVKDDEELRELGHTCMISMEDLEIYIQEITNDTR